MNKIYVSYIYISIALFQNIIRIIVNMASNILSVQKSKGFVEHISIPYVPCQTKQLEHEILLQLGSGWSSAFLGNFRNP